MAKNQTIKSVKGTVDFYPEQMAVRKWLYNTLGRVSKSYGYEEWEGPILEPIELYAAKSGEELVKEQAFVFEDKGGNLITLRPELTPSLARLVAQKQTLLPFPLRWWSYGPMWRYERPQKGRTREFFQWNIDLIGVESPETDAELVAVGASFLKEVGLTPQESVVYVNNRRLMDSSLAALGLTAELRAQAIRLIDRRDKLKPEAWDSYALDLGMSQEQLDGLKALLENKELWKESDELVRFFAAIEAYGLKEYVEFDPQIIRGLDYYTGTVFEARDPERKYRAIFGGGRYDNLVEAVGGQPVSAVGFAMGDKVIQVLLEDLGKLPSQEKIGLAPVLVTVFNEESLVASLSVSARLRETGLNVATYPAVAKLGKQFKYADRIGASIAVTYGP